MKINKFIPIIISLLLFNLFLISAQLNGLQDSVDNLDENLDGVRDLAEDPETTASNYLKKEWSEILNKSESGRVILAIGNVLNALDPVFLLFIGLEYNLSWYFFVALTLWIFVFIIIYYAIKDLFQANPLVRFFVPLIILALAARTNVIVDVTDIFVPIITNPVTILAFFGGVIVLVLLYRWFMDTFGLVIREKVKKEIETRREIKARTAEKIHDIEITARK